MTDKQAQKLSEHKNVKYVDANVYAKASSYDWGLDMLNQDLPPLDGDMEMPSTGSGIDVYLLDTFVDDLHPNLLGNVQYIWQSPNEWDNCTPGSEGHDIKFDNRYAIARLNKDGTIDMDNIHYFENEIDAIDFDIEMMETSEYRYRELGGLTYVGSKTSQMFAGSVHPINRKVLIEMGSQKLNLNSLDSARFSIMHEVGHGTGIRLEHMANSYAVKKLGY